MAVITPPVLPGRVAVEHGERCCGDARTVAAHSQRQMAATSDLIWWLALFAGHTDSAMHFNAGRHYLNRIIVTACSDSTVK